MTSAAEALALLAHSQSAKRRSGARTLRKLGNAAAGPALLEALRTELEDERTWETQFQMIMALGACGYAPAEPLIRELAGRAFRATTLYIAIGDARVRLAEPKERKHDTVLDLARHDPEGKGLGYGACQAMAMLHLVPPRAAIEELLQYASRFPLDWSQTLNHYHWIAAAAAGWLDASPAVRPFLETCRRSKFDQVRLAAESSLQGKYRKWSPA